MPDEPFMLVSLEEAKAKKLANVMSNETCTKLLNYLAKNGGKTESEIAKACGLPLSTVHYNLKQLVAAKLVVADEYHYSSKGREVLHYKLANKYIIIAPQEERPGFFEALKQVLPLIGLTLGVGLILSLLGLFPHFGSMFMQETAGAPDVIDVAELPRGMPLAEQAPAASAEPATAERGATEPSPKASTGEEGAGGAAADDAGVSPAGIARTFNEAEATTTENQTDVENVSAAPPVVEEPLETRLAAPPPKQEVVLVRTGFDLLSWQVIAAFVSGGLFVIVLAILLALLRGRK